MKNGPDHRKKVKKFVVAENLRKKIRLLKRIKHGTNAVDDASRPDQYHVEETEALVEF